MTYKKRKPCASVFAFYIFCDLPICFAVETRSLLQNIPLDT